MDAAKIGELYMRFAPLIFRRCNKLLSDPVLAGDAAQEVFVRAMRHASKLTNDRECLPWLYRVSTNHCLNLIRARNKDPLLPLSSAEDSFRQFEQHTMAEEEARQLLGRLDETDAQIAVYAYLDRMTQGEIAEVTGISRKTIGKKLKRIAETARENRLVYQEAES